MDAVTRIKQECNVVLKLTEVKEKTGILNADIGGTKLDPKAFTMMCNQFSIILGAGIPVGRAVHLIADKTTDKVLKKMLKQTADDVESGRSLAASFEERGGKFLPTTFIETIRSGEASGAIDKAFSSMAEHFDKQTKMSGKVKSALAYPMFVLVIAVIVVIVIMAKVVPVFTAMFADMGAELPLPTRILIGMSNFFKNNYLILIGIIAAIVVFFKFYGNTETGRLNLAKIQRKLPVLGNVSILGSASEFANSMATLLGSGMPMTKAVSITAKVMSNYYVSQEVGKLTGRLEEGYALCASMREANFMPDILVDMVGVGEDTGEMEGTLKTIATYYDSELEVAVSAAVAKLEPAMLVFLAAFAGFIVIAIYMAMFSMYGGM